MSRLFRDKKDKWDNEPHLLSAEERLERAQFELQVAQDNHFEAVQELLNDSPTAIMFKELKNRE
tara:strand:- start:269 stop:460 length:192 start_codon:yes stop_codon:yes gene_type:complete